MEQDFTDSVYIIEGNCNYRVKGEFQFKTTSKGVKVGPKARVSFVSLFQLTLKNCTPNSVIVNFFFFQLKTKPLFLALPSPPFGRFTLKVPFK